MSLAQRKGWQLRVADVTDVPTGAYLAPDAPEAFIVPAELYNWLCFIPDVKVSHSREHLASAESCTF